MTREENKVHYDLTNVHIAPMTSDGDTPAWGEFRRLYGAVSMDLAAQGDTVKLRADAIDYYVSVSNNGYEGDLTLAMVPDWFRELILGETLSPVDKVLVESALAEPKHFAMAYEFLHDKKHRRHLLYNCTAARPNLKGENKDNQREPDTESMNIAASPLPDGKIKASTTEASPESVYENWNKAVWVGDTTAGGAGGV